MRITILSKDEMAGVVGTGPVREVGRKAGSSVRHTRAIQRDRVKRPVSAAPAPAIAERLAEIVQPATLAQVSHYHERGLRERTLTLPVMAALVVSLIGRQFGSVSELVRVLAQEGLPWVDPLSVASISSAS